MPALHGTSLILLSLGTRWQPHMCTLAMLMLCRIVVNLQTMQLLLYYYRMITSEMRLVSLNQIFERAPGQCSACLPALTLQLMLHGGVLSLSLW
jgi:hypothetical protein